MPPTIQDSASSSNSSRSSGQHRSSSSRADIVCRVKYCNNLPDVPFDPKFLVYPFDQNRFVEYKPTSLERSNKHELLTDIDLGVPIDLIDPETYAIKPGATLHPIDEALLEEEVQTPANEKRARQHNKHVSWLRKTEYISSEYNRFTSSGENVETRVGYNVKKKLQGEDMYKDQASQLAAIEKTFQDTQKPITKHHSKPGVVPTEILPVYPDLKLWQHSFAQVLFDGDPSPSGKQTQADVEVMSHAMLRGMVDESQEQFVAYFVPTQETLTSRKRSREEGEEYLSGSVHEYKMLREYNWKIRTKATHASEESYFFVLRPGAGVFYNELPTRVRLNKRRTQTGGVRRRTACARLVVNHREFDESELALQSGRLTQLESAPVEDEADEETGDM